MPATLTSWSNPHEMKSANCISQTGRIPSIAEPMAAPTMALFARLNNRRDIVFVDQRGTGGSAPRCCATRASTS